MAMIVKNYKIIETYGSLNDIKCYILFCFIEGNHDLLSRLVEVIEMIHEMFVEDCKTRIFILTHRLQFMHLKSKL